MFQFDEVVSLFVDVQMFSNFKTSTLSLT